MWTNNCVYIVAFLFMSENEFYNVGLRWVYKHIAFWSLLWNGLYVIGQATLAWTNDKKIAFLSLYVVHNNYPRDIF